MSILLTQQINTIPLINKKARVLKSDIEGAYAVIQVIDTVLIFEKFNPR